MQITFTQDGKPTEIVSYIDADPNDPLFKHTDAEGDKAAVFPSHDQEQGAGVYLLTTKGGCSIPADRLEEFFEACREAVRIAMGT